MNDPAALAVRFNECINARDVEGLAQLMSANHRFIDTVGTAILGKAACVEAWRGFFDAYPEYQNVFDAVFTSANKVTIVGYSLCPGHPELEGRATEGAARRT